MDIVKGSIVKATAGRDKNSGYNGYYVVLALDGDYALIADGKRRKVQKPKRKKRKHLSPTTAVCEGSLDTNPKIKKILRDFNGG